MNIKILTVAVCLAAVISLTGCTFGNNRIVINNEPEEIVTGQNVGTDEEPDEAANENEGPTLSVQADKSEPTETYYTDLNVGDELYSGFHSVVTVKSVDEEKIVLSLDGCLIEPNPNGTINLRAEPLKEITLEKGEDIILASQTMDAGVTLTISYK